VTVCDQHPPLQIIRAFPLEGGGALVHLHNLSGGVLGGDCLEYKLQVGPWAWAQVTSTGATRIYRTRDTVPDAVQVTEIQVAENALLEYVPDPIIPFSGSRYRQRTQIGLDNGAGLFWWEMVAPGREARGEVFQYDLFETKLDISAAGIPLAIERYRLEPRSRPVSSLARQGPYLYWGTFYICRTGGEGRRWLLLEQQLGEIAARLTRPPEVLWGVTTLPAHGVVVRALSQRGRDIASGLLVFWNAAKMAIYGQQAVLPRKIY
jgi:urease accessory protein